MFYSVHFVEIRVHHANFFGERKVHVHINGEKSGTKHCYRTRTRTPKRRLELPKTAFKIIVIIRAQQLEEKTFDLGIKF